MLNLYSVVLGVKKKIGMYPSEKRFADNLHLVQAILDGGGMEGRYWFVGGLVLGYVREGKAIASDRHDVDFGVWAEDIDRLAALFPVFFSQGFKKKIKFISTEGRVAQYSVERQGVCFEFFTHFKTADGSKIRWFTFDPGKKIELEREMPVYSLKPISFAGRQWLIPSDTEKYLTLQYGDWRTPNSRHDYTDDKCVPCNKFRRPWSGKYKWH